MNIPKANLPALVDEEFADLLKEVMTVPEHSLPLEELDIVPFALIMMLSKDSIKGLLKATSLAYILGYRAAMKDAGKKVADVDAKLDSIGGIDG